MQKKNYTVKSIEIEPLVGANIDSIKQTAFEISHANSCMVTFVHNQRQYVVGDKEQVESVMNNVFVKIGTKLVAHDSPKMQTNCNINDTFALIIDKTYEVKAIYGDMIVIESEVSKQHGFSTNPTKPDYFGHWLRLPSEGNSFDKSKSH